MLNVSLRCFSGFSQIPNRTFEDLPIVLCTSCPLKSIIFQSSITNYLFSNRSLQHLTIEHDLCYTAASKTAFIAQLFAVCLLRKCQRFREFVFFHEESIYPEFAVSQLILAAISQGFSPKGFCVKNNGFLGFCGMQCVSRVEELQMNALTNALYSFHGFHKSFTSSINHDGILVCNGYGLSWSKILVSSFLCEHTQVPMHKLLLQESRFSSGGDFATA